MPTEKEKYLIWCFKAYGIGKDETVGTMHALREEKLQDTMIAWIKNHITASPDEVLESAWQIAGLI